MFDSIDFKDLLIRAAKTFYQAFAAVFVLPYDLSTLKVTLAAAVAAGVSAVVNLIYGMITGR